MEFGLSTFLTCMCRGIGLKESLCWGTIVSVALTWPLQVWRKGKMVLQCLRGKVKVKKRRRRPQRPRPGNTQQILTDLGIMSPLHEQMLTEMGSLYLDPKTTVDDNPVLDQLDMHPLL